MTKRFGGLLAVDDCSLRVRTGSVTGLIGPNGAGKTTLFNMIAGAFPPTSGRILFEGREVTGMAPHQLFDLGIARTFQIAQEFANLTVLENLLAAPSQQIGETIFNSVFRRRRVLRQETALRAKAENVAQLLGLSPVRNERAGNISGGQKKLLELGRVMMSEPRLVLLDEIAAGVNRTLLNEIAATIERLNQEAKVTFLVIEHDMDLIARLCDPVIVLVAGTVLVEGSMDDIRRHEGVIDAYFGGGAAKQVIDA